MFEVIATQHFWRRIVDDTKCAMIKTSIEMAMEN